MKRIVIIGSGIGGLSAALELSRYNAEIIVLEAQSKPGGKAGTILFDGQEADTGPSVLTLPQIFEELFASVGHQFSEEVSLVVPQPAFRYLYPDGVQLDIFHEVTDTLESVQKTLGDQAHRDLDGFLRYAKRIWDASADTFVLGDAPHFASILKFGLRGLGQLKNIDATRTMAQAIDAHIRTPHLKDLLLRYATYNGSNPHSAPATLNCIAYVELSLGGYGVQGGIYELVRSLVRVAQKRGVEIQYDSRVTEIVVMNNRVKGVTLNGGTHIPCDAVIANAEPEHVFQDLLPSTRSQKKALSSEPSTSGWTGILRASKNPSRVAHTVLFPETYTQEFKDLFQNKRTPLSPAIYLCDQGIAHQRAGGAHHTPVFVMINAPPCIHPDTTNWSQVESAIHTRLLAAGLCAKEDTFVWRRTPRDLATAFPGSHGAIYGGASNSIWAAFKRPPNRIKSPRHLYLASGGAHPGGGLPLCASSGQAAGRAASVDLQLGSHRR